MTVLTFPGVREPVLVTEYETTRDRMVDHPDGSWSCIPQPPPGPGWVIEDASSDYKTRWRRTILVPQTERGAA